MEWKDIKLYPELIHDAIIYLCVIALICIVSATLSRWQERRRLKKEFEVYQQRREEEEKQ